jgi:hypothetical protein
MAERPDFALYRTIEGLAQKAGVPARLLRRLAYKELTDNGLDMGAQFTIARLRSDGETFVFSDDGDGIDGEPEAIASLFSIGRVMRSSKLMRLPTRGALGNGLRIIAGAVLASQGSLVVVTRNQRVVLEPQYDGSTRVASVTPVDHPNGTRVEIRLGPALPDDPDALAWATSAMRLARGNPYVGRSSVRWYDAPQFQELLYAHGDVPVSALVARLDVSRPSAAAIIAATGLDSAACKDVTREQATHLLTALRAAARPVPASRLGAVGPDAFPGHAYARESDVAMFGAAEPRAEVPFLIEVWAKACDKMSLDVFVNRTPVASDISVVHDKRDINAFCCGLQHTIATARSANQFAIRINVITPYCPITSDGKEPDLLPFFDEIERATQRAVRKAKPSKEDDDDPDKLVLPRRKKGRQSQESEAEYQAQRDAFCRLILRIRSTMDFRVGARGWCYLLEHHGLTKGNFAATESLITDCRKTGELPLDICAEDDSRASVGLEDIDDSNVEREAQGAVDHLRDHGHESYTPFSFWDDLDVYVEVGVEKLDLRNLFASVCAEFRVPITNFKGWSDLNARAAMMRRFAAHKKAGRKCVLLLCGDHDPGGLQITDAMRGNLEDLQGAVGWSSANLVITRFGLNADFINRLGLTWIDNLETSSGGRLDDPRHRDHRKAYVQDYIRRFGVRKVEANALVVRPTEGRDLCRQAILAHVPADAVDRYNARLAVERERLRREIQRRLGE